MALQVAQKLPWLSGESPRRLAPALTRFVTCSPVWDGQDVVYALTDAATRQGKTPPGMDRQVQRPWALLAAMLRELDEVNDYPNSPFPTSPAAGPSCDRPNCDGWIPVSHAGCGTDGAVRPCPDLAHRRANRLDVADGEWQDGDDWEGGECPF